MRFPARRAPLFLALALILPLHAAAGPQSPFPPDTPKVEALEAMVLDMVNQARAEENLPPLSPDPRLAAAARQHSEEMRDLNYMGHVSPVDAYRTLGRRLSAAGASEATNGENVGFYASNKKGQAARDFVKFLHEGLMKSPRHRANILKPDFTAAGIGIAIGERPADEDPDTLLPSMWITEVFARRTVEVDMPAATLTADGLMVLLSGTTEEKNLSLSISGTRGEPFEDLELEGGRFEKRLVIPFSSGPVRLELCVPEGRKHYRVTNAWVVRPDLRPEEAVRAAPSRDDE